MFVTLGVLAWIFIVRRRNKDTTPISTSTKSRPPSITYLADTERAQDRPDQIRSPKLSPPPAYSPGSMKSSSASDKKATPTLNVEIDHDANESATLPSPIRSASFNPSAKTQSFGSRISSRMSTGAKKLYVHPSSLHSARPKLELTHFVDPVQD